MELVVSGDGKSSGGTVGGGRWEITSSYLAKLYVYLRKLQTRK